MQRTYRFLLATVLAALASLLSMAALAQDGRIINFQATPNPSALNQQVSIHADINWADIKAQGTLTYYSGGVVIPGCESIALSNGTSPPCVTRFSAAGTYSLTVSYSGDSTYPASTSAPISQVVDSSTLYYPVTSTSAFPADTYSGSTLVSRNTTGVADLVVKGGDQVATGTVDFFDGILARCTGVALQPAQYDPTVAVAECRFPVSRGSHRLTMNYSGDARYRPTSATATLGAPGFKRILDFDGDGLEDQLVRGADGSITAWHMDRLTIKSTTFLMGGVTTDVLKSADLNGDGITDLVRELPDGSTWAYLMNASGIASQAELRAAGSGWHVTHAADFNGDGKIDLLWRHDSGAVEMWLMDGTTTLQSAAIMPAGTPWVVQLVGDFNGDLRNDLVWRNTADGTVGLWLMDGTTQLQRNTIMPAGTGWTPTHVADLDSDGMADLLWRHDSGMVGAWLMNGTTTVQHRTLMPAGTGWSITQVGGPSYYGAKHALVWTNTDGSVGIWDMNGLDLRNRVSQMGPGTGWHVTEYTDGDGTGAALVWTHDNGAVGMWWLPYLTMSQRQPELAAGSGSVVISNNVQTRVAP